MHRLIAIVGLFASTVAFAAPAFPVTLESEYCALGCVPVVATLYEDGTCEFDLVGDCVWDFDRRTRTLTMEFALFVEATLRPRGRCLFGRFDPGWLGIPGEDMEFCPV